MEAQDNFLKLVEIFSSCVKIVFNYKIVGLVLWSCMKIIDGSTSAVSEDSRCILIKKGIKVLVIENLPVPLL